jgi:hypothetical protein
VEVVVIVVGRGGDLKKIILLHDQDFGGAKRGTYRELGEGKLLVVIVTTTVVRGRVMGGEGETGICGERWEKGGGGYPPRE